MQANIHPVERIVDGLSFFANALSSLSFLVFQLLDLGFLAFSQLLRVDAGDGWLCACPACTIGVLVRGERQDLERGDVLEGDDVVVAGLVCEGGGRVRGSGGGVDCDDVELGAGCEEGAFEGLRVRCDCCDSDSVRG